MDRLDQRKPYWRDADDDDEPDYSQFQASHRSLSDKVERFLMHVVILGLVALTLVQTLHTNRTARRMLNLVEGLEGIPWEHVTAWTNDRELATPVSAVIDTPVVLTVVCITSRSVPEARLLVNGRPVGTFKDGSVSATVLPGQSVEIDGSQTSKVLSFRVVGPSDLISPVLGSSVTTSRSTESLGTISAVGRK